MEDEPYWFTIHCFCCGLQAIERFSRYVAFPTNHPRAECPCTTSMTAFLSPAGTLFKSASRLRMCRYFQLLNNCEMAFSQGLFCGPSQVITTGGQIVPNMCTIESSTGHTRVGKMAEPHRVPAIVALHAFTRGHEWAAPGRVRPFFWCIKWLVVCVCGTTGPQWSPPVWGSVKTCEDAFSRSLTSWKQLPKCRCDALPKSRFNGWWKGCHSSEIIYFKSLWYSPCIFWHTCRKMFRHLPVSVIDKSMRDLLHLVSMALKVQSPIQL